MIVPSTRLCAEEKFFSFNIFFLTNKQNKQQPLFPLVRKNKKEEKKETIENNIIEGI